MKKPKYKLIQSFPPGIKVVGLLQYKDRVLLATEEALYELIDDKLEVLPIKYEEEPFEIDEKLLAEVTQEVKDEYAKD